MSMTLRSGIRHALPCSLLALATWPAWPSGAIDPSSAPVLLAQAGPSPAGALPPAGGPPPGAGPPGPGGPPPGGAAGPGGMMMPASHAEAGIYVSGGKVVSAKQYADRRVNIAVAPGAAGVDGRSADGVLLTSTDYGATGLVVADGRYEFGGGKDYYTVYTNRAADYVGSSVKSGPDKIGSFNSVLLFTLDQDIPASAKIGSSGIDADHQAVLNVDKVYMQVDGGQRYVDSTYGSAKTIVNDSYFVSTGNADHHTDAIKGPFSNEALFISGVARANFSINSSATYYFNSTVITEGWAALSTDASQGAGLDLYAYNTHAHALNGGYGTYADFGCRVWLYGSTIESAEVGAIISKSGEIHLFDGGSADAKLLAYNKGKTTEAGTTLTGGRNALMIHAPDMFGAGIGAADYGHFSAKNSTLSTSRKLVGKFDYATYGDAAKKYVDFVSGDIILIKSTSARIDLDHDMFDSYDGVLVHSVMNSDRMSNFLAAGDNGKTGKDGSLIVKPISIYLSNLSATGAILHDDFQRNMEIHFRAAKLEGRIRQGTASSWKDVWAAKRVSQAYWLPKGNWTGSDTLSVTLDAKSSWVVTAPSTLSSLTVASGATLTAPKGGQLTMTVNGAATPIAPGDYKGAIVLTPQ